MSRHSASGTAWEAQRQRVLERDGWTCVYCSTPIEGPNATVDHVQPIALQPGREYRDDELASACRSCNARKGNRPTLRVNYTNPRWTTPSTPTTTNHQAGTNPPPAQPTQPEVLQHHP